MNEKKRKNRVDPVKLGLWECCDGVWYTASGRCRKCGKSRDEKLQVVGQNQPAGVQKSKFEPDPLSALDGKPEGQDFVPRDDAEFIIVLCRGYSRLPLDMDNLVASSKFLRDAIAEKILKTASDAEKSGLQWEYRQFKGQGTTVAIYQRPKDKVLS